MHLRTQAYGYNLKSLSTNEIAELSAGIFPRFQQNFLTFYFLLDMQHYIIFAIAMRELIAR